MQGQFSLAATWVIWVDFPVPWYPCTITFLLCKKPLVHYSDSKYKFSDENGEIEKPFILRSNEPIEIAEAIDAIVNSEKIREETIEKGFNFIQKIANSSKIVQEWDTIFEKFSNEYEITKNTSKLKIGLLEVLYLASNRLHSRKISKIFK